MYNEKAKKPLSFPLIYLVLPLVLHKETRSHINSRTKFHLWIQKNPDLLIDFPKRTRDLVPITNESIEFLLQTGLVKLTSTGELQISSDLNALNKKKFVDDEITECLTKSEHIARWFVEAGTVETIYVQLGVRP
jgi:hypothetical protein